MADIDIEGLSDDQLDRLSQRLKAREKELGDAPVVCRDGASGIEWHSGYGNSTTLEKCRKCAGRGWVERRSAPESPSWDAVAALIKVAKTLQDSFGFTVAMSSAGVWKAVRGDYTARFKYSGEGVADYELVSGRGAAKKTSTRRGTGLLVFAIVDGE